MSARLVIIGLIAIAFLSLGGLALYWRGNAIAATAERDKAYADLRVAIEANRTNLDAIEKLKADADRNSEITLKLAEELADSNAAAMANAEELARLKTGNPDVKTFLDMAVPGSVDGLLNR